MRVRSPGRDDIRWAFPAIWLVFLAYPVISLLGADESVARTVAGLALIAAFGALYVVACVHVIPMQRSSPDPRVALRYFVVLALIAAATEPILANGCLSFGPFLIAITVFGLSRPFGIAVTAVVVGLALIGPEVLDGWDFDPGTVIALVVSGGAMLVARNLQLREREREAAEERKRELDEQLAVIAERERVARDVHDILGHSLTVITLKSELAGRLIDIDPERAKAELAELHSMSRRALAEVRSTVGGLRTPDLRTELASARTALTAAEIEADLPTDLADLPPARSALFAWVVRESVTNVVRHSGARRCAVDVTDGHIEVVDDGCGIDEHAFGNGLRGLTERVDAAGGALSVRATGTGTAVRVTVG
ncbi:sensor histidine kinase [Williamsia phyllosphaerae]|uniref:sensor histidine kinase n=1 Tax=Williamsia phyllosphaerae TaxID=885042 RepID=UPI00166DCAAB|nr:sensor histidine kinase [Williamsia phyllosphaerae]